MLHLACGWPKTPLGTALPAEGAVERPHIARYPPCTPNPITHPPPSRRALRLGGSGPPPPAAALCLWGVLASLYRQKL